MIKMTQSQYEKLDFDECKPLNSLSFLNMRQESQDIRSETAEEIFMDELIAENPEAMVALSGQLLTPENTRNSELEKVFLSPSPGFVIKSLTKTSYQHYQENTKLMINVCYSDSIPPPPTVDDVEIKKAMNADENAIYHVPASLDELREDKDKVQNLCLVCDAIINTEPYKRTKKDSDFKLYVSELLSEMVEEKHGIQLIRRELKKRTVFIPKTRTCLITEVPTKLIKTKSSKENLKATNKRISSVKQPEYIIAEDYVNDKKYIIVSIEIPLNSQSIKETTLDIEPLQIILNSPGICSLNIALPFKVDIKTVIAKFIRPKKRLVIKAAKAD
ncbi:7715_t:CDS:2 [Diversispora eburnea]|uniref:PIH1 domain-containing protein 1 n=1 Tax=Diversispora eburnea TaxID=1213867 RepID=A0A9N9BA36_9GLOM|nr:7715_t:CDS:2 [Diversispora eburnea]